MPSTIADLLSSLYGDDAGPGIAAGHDIGRASLRGLTRVFDILVEGVLILDDEGRVAYVNPALARVLCDEQERAELLPRMRRLAASLEPPPDDAYECVGTSAEVRTPTARYLLRAARVEGDVAGARRAAVVVAVERLTAQLPTAESLVERFGLTAGEARVALLLAQGHSNCGIARALEISPHTARHHTESVLLKLDVHSRAEVGPKLLGTRQPPGPTPTR
jgi:DNA-binding CsgD family transcriptional regulator